MKNKNNFIRNFILFILNYLLVFTNFTNFNIVKIIIFNLNILTKLFI